MVFQVMPTCDEVCSNISTIFNALSASDIINTDPVVIDEHATISDVLNLIKSKEFLISYLPVIGMNRKIIGALSFIHLIRSES